MWKWHRWSLFDVLITNYINALQEFLNFMEHFIIAVLEDLFIMNAFTDVVSVMDKFVQLALNYAAHRILFFWMYMKETIK